MQATNKRGIKRRMNLESVINMLESTALKSLIFFNNSNVARSDVNGMTAMTIAIIKGMILIINKIKPSNIKLKKALP